MQAIPVCEYVTRKCAATFSRMRRDMLSRLAVTGLAPGYSGVPAGGDGPGQIPPPTLGAAPGLQPVAARRPAGGLPGVPPHGARRLGPGPRRPRRPPNQRRRAAPHRGGRGRGAELPPRSRGRALTDAAPRHEEQQRAAQRGAARPRGGRGASAAAARGDDDGRGRHVWLHRPAVLRDRYAVMHCLHPSRLRPCSDRTSPLIAASCVSNILSYSAPVITGSAPAGKREAVTATRCPQVNTRRRRMSSRSASSCSSSSPARARHPLLLFTFAGLLL
jgi:hypothetical protein